MPKEASAGRRGRGTEAGDGRGGLTGGGKGWVGGVGGAAERIEEANAVAQEMDGIYEEVGRKGIGDGGEAGADGELLDDDTGGGWRCGWVKLAADFGGEGLL